MTKRFTVFDTRTQSKKSWNSEATTVGELKRELANLGISTNGMAIQEGLTKVEFINDDSVLPTEVPDPRTGEMTSNLLFRLTKTNKNIESGADRKELYEVIKRNELQSAIKNKFGKNYTNVSTDDLDTFINETLYYPLTGDVKTKPTKESLIDALVKAMEAIHDNLDLFNEGDLLKIASAIEKIGEPECPWSDEEIRKIFNWDDNDYSEDEDY